MSKLELHIDIPSLFREGLDKVDSRFLIALINGYQGSGKSYFAIYLVEKFYSSSKVYTNIQSYHSTKHEVHYFHDLSEIYDNTEKFCIFIVDEMSKKYVKDSKIDRPFYSWLQQSRKNNRVVFLITQEYLQVPNWLRGIANVSYTTKPLLFCNLCKTTLGTPVLDKETCEWTLDTFGYYYYKRNKYYSKKYDTYECIDSL
mgnify:CR=1 FL=1